MAIKLQHLLNSRLSIALGYTLSKVPTAIGYRVAHWLANFLASRKNNLMVRSVRANQWVVNDMRPTAQDLDLLVRRTYQSAARSLYEFWHYVGNSQAVLDMVEFDASFFDTIAQVRQRKRGALLVVPHISNFDLIGRAAVYNGINIHILSYPQPSGGYRWQNALRQLPGLTVTPMSIAALRQASNTLHEGGIVVTGIDRPLPTQDSKYEVSFFGRPATLPVFHIRLALKHNLPIVVIGGRRNANGRYHVWAFPPIPMQPSDDLVHETVRNAESVLDVLARVIRKAPDQWAMFYPVWPEALEQMPL